MANASILAMKEQHVAEIKDRLTRAQSVVMFDYRGLTVDEVTALRVEMRKAGVEYIVLKNTMVERACRELNIDESVHAMLKGPSAFAFGYDDAVAPAKILKDSIKKFKKCTNVLKIISPIFIEISAKTLDFTKLHKRFKHIS